MVQLEIVRKDGTEFSARFDDRQQAVDWLESVSDAAKSIIASYEIVKLKYSPFDGWYK